MSARLAQSVEHQTFNLRVEGSSPSLGADILQVNMYICRNSIQYDVIICTGFEPLTL